MKGNERLSQTSLVEGAAAWLQARLPASWAVAVSTRQELGTRDGQADAAIELRGQNVSTTLAVEAKRSFGPRDVDRLLGSVGRTIRALSPSIPIMVVAPWLSSRTQELLVAEGMNYIDLTGNALVRLENPALFIETDGAACDPSPPPPAKARVRGPKAGRLIRMLVDVGPPYGVRELAEATGLAQGYVSRLLEALDEEALIERAQRGRVQSVDIGGLLRRWATSYDLFKSNDARTFLAAPGLSRTLTRLVELAAAERVAVTGSFAAVRLAPVAAPSLLCVYCENQNAVAEALDLIPADAGANVVLLRPYDPVAWERTTTQEGLMYVAPSQIAVDCLTGNGRMPAEGEAVLQWMLANEATWRPGSLEDVASS